MATFDASPRDVVYVIASMITGGTQTHLLQVLRFLDHARYRPHLFCLRERGDLIPHARALNVNVTTFGMSGTLKSPGDLVGLARVTMALRRLRPAVVHGYLLRGNFYGALAARAAGVPVVITSKRGLHRPTGRSERVAVAVSNRLSDVMTGNSPAVLEFTRDVEPAVKAPMEMIPSGIDTDVFDPRTAGDLRGEMDLGARPVVGTAITWRPRKGFRMLFEAFARIRESYPEARLLIAGEREWALDPARLADALGIRDAVVLLGKRTDMPRVLGTLDVFVLPSESEGMSNALLEAMAMARPCVATAVGGNLHVIGEGGNGFLVPYPDSSALAERVNRLFADPGLRSCVGAAARDRVVGSFSARSMVRQMEKLYDRLLQEVGR
jgi:glycosyltransferase involved in cell wall biosynthesis